MIHRSLASPPVFSLAGNEGGVLTLKDPLGAVVKIFVLEPDIIRVAVLPHGAWSLDRSWAIAPGEADVPHEGRSRDDVRGFSCPAFVSSLSAERLVVETEFLRLSVRLSGFHCSWEMRRHGEWISIARDRPTQAYDFGWWDGRPSHFMVRRDSEAFYGLGECSGDMDRAGRRIRLSNTDALGYSARHSDPLYKHIPFVITRDAVTGSAYGLFHDTLADCTYDFGNGRSNYHGLFRSFVAEAGDLDYYMIAGPDIGGLTRRFTWLTGRPAFMPRWSLGYSGSTMSYTDAPDAQAQMNRFLERCGEHDILCSSFHLSSGYTSIGSKRYVFHWNRDKFPDPAGFVARYAAHGVKLVPNIKPVLLRDHPQFETCAQAGHFIANPDGSPCLMQFWGELGASIDFTNPRAADWWKGQVTSALLDVGMAATWNDNNEYEVMDPSALADFNGHPRPAREVKPLQSLLMVRASREAQTAFSPGKRPFVVTRAGFAGMQRYAQTWSGDNTSTWEALKYNLRMGLGLALSGVSNTGHDVGGFAGAAPDEELFLRWVEFGIFLPRFSIHSWNDDGTVNEPWMHPRIVPLVRNLIRLRARLEPYLYALMWQSHSAFDPVMRPVMHDFPDDPESYREHDTMMLGPALLVAPVLEAGVVSRDVRLPAGAVWVDYWTGRWFAGGQVVHVDAPWGRPPLFVRAGHALPVNLAALRFGDHADARGFLVFPHEGEGRFGAFSVEDDGESVLGADGSVARMVVEVESSHDGIHVRARHDGRSGQVTLVFPVGEVRAVTGDIVSDAVGASWREVVIGVG